MKKNKNKSSDIRIRYSLFSPLRFVFAFIMVGFVVTTSFLLFSNPGWDDGQVISDGINITVRAVSTFFNIIFLCIAFSVIDSTRRKYNFGIPLQKILDATHEIMKGNFKVRIEPMHTFRRKNEFDIIMEDFNKMAEELDSNATMKNDFIADVSHEFKTPLAVIQNYATMIQQPDLDEEKRQEYAKILCHTSKNLSDLVSNVLRLNKLESQQIFPEKTLYNLSGQICESMLLFEKELESKSLNIELDLDEELLIEADYDLLSHVWNNLFSNAVKFTDFGGKISISLKKHEKYAITKISDSGCGMDENTCKHIFEKFYQGDSSRATNGNGLGLALVKRVVDITDGTVTVESEPGKGTTFTVALPLK